jgi:predicted porin
LTALFATAAFAQSTVTLSGQVDIGVVNPIGADKLRIDQSANGANQIVFSGSEDLGGGLRATFRLAQRFSPESGLNDGTYGNRPAFQGETTVGLAGPFGTLRIGRALTALRGPVDNTDPWGTLQQASVAVVATGYASSPDNEAVFYDAGATPPAYEGVETRSGSGAGRIDGLHYVSPSFGGLTAALTYGPKSTQITGLTTTGANQFVSAWLQYVGGPLVVGLGGEENRAGDRITAAQLSYDLGVAKVGATYGIVDLASTALDRKAFNVSATAPMGPMAFKVGYGRSKLEGAEASVKKVGVGLDYALSKRTLVYTSYGRDKGTTFASGSKSGYDLGVRHTF